MKKEKIIEILILISIVAIITIGVCSCYYYAKIKPNLYNIEFNDADSIIKGSPVRFMGIIVGHVRNLDRKDDKISCQIVITKPHTKIPDGSFAQIEFNGLGGSKSVEITPPNTNDPQIKGIIAHDTLRLNDVFDSFKYMGEVFTIIKEFVDGITPESSLKTVQTLSQTPDLGPLNKSLDTMIENQQKTNEGVKRINKFQAQSENLVDTFIKKTGEIKTFLKHN